LRTFLGLSEAPRPWRLKILIWRSKFEVAPYIGMVLFLVANCTLILKCIYILLFKGQFQPLEVKYGQNIWNFQILFHFDVHTRICNLHSLWAPDRPKKKYAEIDFTSHHSFLSLRIVRKINLKLPHTKKKPPAYCLCSHFSSRKSWSPKQQVNCRNNCCFVNYFNFNMQICCEMEMT
jgi:hypothetical protein